MLHSQRLSNNPYPEPNNPIPCIDTYFIKNILILSSHLRLGLSKGLFPVCSLAKNFENTPTLPHSTCPS